METKLTLCAALMTLFIASCSDTPPTSPMSDNTTATAQQAPLATAAQPIPAELLVPFQSFTIEPHSAQTITVPNSRTKIHVPPNAFVDEAGSPVTTPVEIKFREYTNCAEIAFSNIPMTYKNGEEELRMSSAGMFEIEGYSAGKEVNIAQGMALNVDYELAQKNPDLHFFALDENTQQWTKLHEIKKEAPANVAESAVKVIKKNCDTLQAVKKETLPPQGIAENALNNMPVVLQKEELKTPKDWSEKDIAEWKMLGGKTAEEAQLDRAKLFNRNVQANAVGFVDNPNDRTTATLLGGGMNVDPGHSYPDVVRGLQVRNFGVYNCDQIYRVKAPISIAAKYVDKAGNEIENGHVLSLIDLKYNGAFSFNPQYFTCSAEGKNVLLLFTKSGDIYACPHSRMEQMDLTGGGNYEFEMDNITQLVSTTQDLKEYLGLDG